MANLFHGLSLLISLKRLPGRLRRLGVLLVLASVFLGQAARAEQGAVSEYGLKAVLLYKLPQFVYWPETAKTQGRLIFCIAGANPFGNALERLAREPVDGRSAEVINLVAIGDNINCDFIFVSRSEAASMDMILRKLAGKRMVTVSDIPGFAKAGGMVELTVDGDRVGVTLNRKAAQKHGLEFNAQLLRLAKVLEP